MVYSYDQKDENKSSLVSLDEAGIFDVDNIDTISLSGRSQWENESSDQID